MALETSITIGELLPTVAALVGIGVSWGSLSSKIDAERERNSEVIKRVEQKIESLEDDQTSLMKELHDMRTKIEQIHDRVMGFKRCPDCIFRAKDEAEIAELKHQLYENTKKKKE